MISGRQFRGPRWRLVALAVFLLQFGLAPFGWGQAQRAAAPPVSEPVVARVYFASEQELANLARELDIWEVHRDQGYLVALLSPERYASLQQAGVRVEPDESRTASLSRPRAASPGQTSGIPGYSCYRTVEETYAAMQTLASEHPRLAEWKSIGQSWQRVKSGVPAGYDLMVLVLTNRDRTESKPRFFLMAEIHAREYTTAETAARYAETLVSRYGTDPDVTWLLDTTEIHILVMANPDGRKPAEQGQLWRKNVDSTGCALSSEWGVDLNRNSSYQWGGSSTSPCYETYQGPTAASEPETQAVQAYVKSLYPDGRAPTTASPAAANTSGLFITLHSYGGLVLWPWGWSYAAAPNAAQLQTLGRKFAYFNNYLPQQSVELYPTTGSTDDWAYGTLGIASYTFEMGTDFFEPCSSFENTVYPDNLNALLYAAKAARRPYQAPAGPDSLQVTVAPTATVTGTAVLTATADSTLAQGAANSRTIAAARFSVDAPSWVTGTITCPMAPVDGRFDSAEETLAGRLNTTGLASGQHIVFVESEDAAGNWGVPSAVFLQVKEGAAANSYTSLCPTYDLPLVMNRR